MTPGTPFPQIMEFHAGVSDPDSGNDQTVTHNIRYQCISQTFRQTRMSPYRPGLGAKPNRRDTGATKGEGATVLEYWNIHGNAWRE